MTRGAAEKHTLMLLLVGLAGWLVPGGGYFLLKEKKRASIICIAIILTFAVGLYVGSIGVVDPKGAKAWYCAQMLTSPLVILIGNNTAMGEYPVYGRPAEIGQIYTSIAGLLNLLVIVNAVYLAHVCRLEERK
jgi:hypothetical protein